MGNSGKFVKRLNDISQKKSFFYVIMALTIALQLFAVTYFFAFWKDGGHIDELWYYGLSNSYYNPHLYGPDLGTYDYINQWIDGDEFLDYLSVDESERFSYDSVYYNQTHDVHPPLAYYILHTVCSFFPGTFSFWYGFIIGIISLAIAQVFLAKTTLLFTNSRLTAWIVCLFYGSSIAFIYTGLFVRQYSLLTMLSVIYLYFHARLYYNKGSQNATFMGIAAFTFLGAHTNHFMLVLAFFMTACFVFYFLFKKQFQVMFRYALSSLFGAVLSLGLFPEALNQMFFTETKNESMKDNYDLINALRYNLSTVCSELTGYSFTYFSTSTHAYIFIILVFVLALSLPLCFLLRNEEWVRSFGRTAVGKIKGFLKNLNFLALLMIISFLCVTLIISFSVNVMSMNIYMDRYFFFVMPWIALLIVYILTTVIKWVKPLRRYSELIAVFVCLTFASLTIINNIYYDGRHVTFVKYVERSTVLGEGNIASTCSEGSEHLVITSTYWHIVPLSNQFIGCGREFTTMLDEMSEYAEEIGEIDYSKDCYVVLSIRSIPNVDVITNIIEGSDESSQDILDANVGASTTINFSKSDEDEETEQATRGNLLTIIERIEALFPGHKLEYYGYEINIWDGYIIFRIVLEDEFQDVFIQYYDRNGNYLCLNREMLEEMYSE